MADAEWDAISNQNRARRIGVAIRLTADHLITLLRTWVGIPLTRRTPFDGIRQDARYAWRSLRRTPALLAVATVIIGLGVGATSSVLSIANGLLLRTPAGIRAPDELVTVHALGQNGSSFHTFSAPDFRDLRDAWQGQVDLASYHVFMTSATLGRDAEVLFGFAVSGGYFSILRTNPALGRLLAPTDEESATSAQRVTVLSHATWRDRFGADSSVIGRSVTLNGEPFTIVGVAEPGFGGHIGGIAGALWVPLAASLGPDAHAKLTNRRQTWLEIIGRAPGLAPAQVAERISTTLVLLGRAAGLDWDRRVDVRGYSSMPAPMLLPVLGFLGLLLVLGGTVLLISSSNIAGVMVARAMARSRDTAIRLAIGASRSRLIRQLLIETLIVFTSVGHSASPCRGVPCRVWPISRFRFRFHSSSTSPPIGGSSSPAWSWCCRPGSCSDYSRRCRAPGSARLVRSMTAPPREPAACGSVRCWSLPRWRARPC